MCCHNSDRCWYIIKFPDIKEITDHWDETFYWTQPLLYQNMVHRNRMQNLMNFFRCDGLDLQERVSNGRRKRCVTVIISGIEWNSLISIRQGCHFIACLIDLKGTSWVDECFDPTLWFTWTDWKNLFKGFLSEPCSTEPPKSIRRYSPNMSHLDEFDHVYFIHRWL